MSYRSVAEYRRTGMMPYDGSDPTFAAQSKAAFSSSVAHDFDEEDHPGRDREDHGAGAGGGGEFQSDRWGDDQPPALNLHHRDRDEDEYAPLQQSEIDDIGRRPTPAYDPTAHGANSGMGMDRPIIPMPDVDNTPGSLMHDYDTSYGGPYRHQSQGSSDYGYGR